MKYTYSCPCCGDEKIIEKSIQTYKSTMRVYCLGNQEHTRRLMKRVYQPTRATFRGDGFTGAMGSLPKMDRKKREQDLASDSGVKG